MPISDAHVDRDGDDFMYTWPDEDNDLSHVMILVNNVREDKEATYADLKVLLNGDAQTLHLHGPVKHNLTSTQSAERLAGYLTKRSPAGIVVKDWLVLLEQTASQTVEAIRTGEPSVLLSVGEEIGSVRFAIDGLLPLDETTVIAAAGGKGKGWVALAIAIAYAARPDFCKRPVHTRGRPNVLYLDYEETEPETRRRAQWLARGMRIPAVPPELAYRHMVRPIADEINPLRAEIARRQVGLVIVDSLGPATGDNLNDSEAAIRTMNAIRRLSPASRLVLAHVNKADARGQNKGNARIIGHVYFENLCRSCWEMQADGDGDEINLGLLHVKANAGRKQRGFGLTLTFDDERHEALISPGDIRDVPDAMEHLTAIRKAWSAVEDGPKSLSDISALTGEDTHTLYIAFKRRNSGMTRHGRDGKSDLWGRLYDDTSLTASST